MILLCLQVDNENDQLCNKTNTDCDQLKYSFHFAKCLDKSFELQQQSYNYYYAQFIDSFSA